MLSLWNYKSRKNLSFYYILSKPNSHLYQIPLCVLPFFSIANCLPLRCFLYLCLLVLVQRTIPHETIFSRQKINKKIENNTVNVWNDIDSFARQNLLLESPIHQCTGLDIAGFKVCTGIIIVNGVTNRRIIDTDNC